MNKTVKYALEVSGAIVGAEEGREKYSQFFCPACHQSVVVKQQDGKSIFVHSTTSNCEHAYEASMRLYAVKLLEEYGRICIPASDKTYQINYDDLFPVRYVNVKSVDIENHIENVVPHIVIILESGRRINLDILITNKPSEALKRKVIESGISTIELNLNYATTPIDDDEFKTTLIDSVIDKKWVFDRDVMSFSLKLNQFGLVKELIKSGDIDYVKHCPLKVNETTLYSLNLVEANSCRNCPFNVKKNEEQLVCVGHIDDIEHINHDTVDKLEQPIIKSIYQQYNPPQDIHLAGIVELWKQNPYMRPLVVRNNFSNRIYEISYDPMECLLNFGEVYGVNQLADKKKSEVVYFHSREVWSVIEVD